MPSASSGASSSGPTGRRGDDPFARDQPQCKERALALLRVRGYTVKRVVRVYSPGDSGLGKQLVLYVDGQGHPAAVTVEQDGGRLVVKTAPEGQGW